MYNTRISADRVEEILALYRKFFHLPERAKARTDMARTGTNRGWGAAGSEQVDPDANPDCKQFFDCGFTLPNSDPRADLEVYAPNLWREMPPAFKPESESYYGQACDVATGVLRAVAKGMAVPYNYFDNAFEVPTALLGGISTQNALIGR